MKHLPYAVVILIAVFLSGVVGNGQSGNTKGDDRNVAATGDRELTERIERLIRGLDDDDFNVRERSEQELIKIGEPAMEAVRKATNSSSLEVRFRAKRVYQKIAPPPLPVMLLSSDFSRDGSLLVTGGDSVRVYETKSGTLRHQVHPPKITRTVAFSPAKKEIFASAGDDGAIRLWNVAKPNPVLVLKGHSSMVSDIAFSSDGSLLASGGTRYAKGKAALGEFRLWDTGTGKLIRQLDIPNVGVACVAFSNDGRLLAFSKNSAKKDVTSTIEVYDVSTWKPVSSISFAPGFALSVLFTSDDNKLIITGGVCVRLSPKSCRPTGKVWFADRTSGKPAKPLDTKPSGYFRSAGVTPQGNLFATGTDISRLPARIQMRKADTAEILWVTVGEIGDVSGVKFSPDGKLVACCSGRKILFLDAKTGMRLRSIDVSR